MAASPTSFAEFWPQYLRAHLDPRTRALHYLGSSIVLVLLLAFVASGDWRCLVAVPITGYAFAWGAHFLVEHNRPTTFGHPLWSVVGDFYMLYLWATGRIAPEIARATRRV
jgi:hypothetical protein